MGAALAPGNCHFELFLLLGGGKSLAPRVCVVFVCLGYYPPSCLPSKRSASVQGQRDKTGEWSHCYYSSFPINLLEKREITFRAPGKGQ